MLAWQVNNKTINKINSEHHQKIRTDKEQEIIFSVNTNKKDGLFVSSNCISSTNLVSDDKSWNLETNQALGTQLDILEDNDVVEPNENEINEMGVSTEDTSIPIIKVQPNYWNELRDTTGIIDWVIKFFPELKSRQDNIEALIKDAYEIGSSVFGAESAVKWAQDFKIPKESINKDVNAFISEHNRDFISFVKARQEILKEPRLNKDRIKKIC